MRPYTSASAILAAALVWPMLCNAEAAGGGYVHFSPADWFGIALVLALPTAAATVTSELVASRRNAPLWLGIVSAIFALLFAAIALKGLQQPTSSRDSLFLWFIIPPLVTLALRAVLRHPLERLGAGWIIALGALALVHSRQPDAGVMSSLAGGATCCLVAWSIALTMAWLRGASAPEDSARTPRSELRSAVAAFKPTLHDAADQMRAAPAGLAWWFAATLALYLGIGAALSMDKLGGMWIYDQWQQVADLFGIAPPRARAPQQLWWLFGLPWSLIVGALLWGLAGTLRLFDPGRARSARLAAIVFGGALLAWTAQTVIRDQAVQAREEQAAALHR
jgi:hypothetical protein